MEPKFRRFFEITCVDCGKIGQLGLIIERETDGHEPTDEEWGLYFELWKSERGDPICTTCMDRSFDVERRN